MKRPLVFLRIAAAFILLVRCLGLTLYPYSIEMAYKLYSIFLILALGVSSFAPISIYKSRIGILVILVNIALLAFTINYTMEDYAVLHVYSFKLLAARFIEMIILLSFTIIAVLNRFFIPRHSSDANGCGGS